MAWGPTQAAARKRYREKRWKQNLCGHEGCPNDPDTYYYCAEHRLQRRKRKDPPATEAA